MTQPPLRLTQAYERLRQHARQPGSVVGIDSWVVLIDHGVATWLTVVRLGPRSLASPAEGCPDRRHSSESSSLRPAAALTSVDQEAMFDVFFAMLIAHEQESPHA